MSAPRLPVPVRRVLDDVLDEDALQRAYAGIRAKRAARERAPHRAWKFAFAAVIGVALVVLAWSLRTRDPGPIALARGGALEAVAATGTLELALDDGSLIALDAGAKLSPLDNGGQRVVLLLERGRARFEVKPGGTRRWVIECGAVTVEVVGTGFTVDRGETSVRVDVSHGVVLVRGEAVPDRIRRLDAGESIEVPLGASAPASSAPDAPLPSASGARGAISPPTPSSSEGPASVGDKRAFAWRDLAARGAFGDAYDLLGASGIRERATSASVDELFLLADVARLSGHAGEAIAPLERILREHATDRRAALAAFTLGKLFGGDAAAAASMFERAIQLGLPGTLQGDARARWLDACKKLGDAACEARAKGG